MAKTRTPKFKKILAGRTPAPDDSRGRVQISIRLVEPGGRVVVGNVSRTMSVADTTVTDVANAIDRALFDGTE